jgi:hypothetical protein
VVSLLADALVGIAAGAVALGLVTAVKKLSPRKPAIA